MESSIRVCVTGGHGFVGCAVVRSLIEAHPQWTISIIDLVPTPLVGVFTKAVDYINVDIVEANELREAIAKLRPDIVIHTAGFVPSLADRYHRQLEHKCQHVNVEGTRNVLAAARSAECQALVYTSSCTAVMDGWGTPYANIDEEWPPSRQSSIYGESKVAAEELVVAANSDEFSTCVLRPAVIFGEGDSQLVPPNHACIAKGETPFVVGDGNNLWDVVYVGNVALAHLLAAENLLGSKTAAGETFFVQNNEPITFRELQLAIWRNFGHSPSFQINIPKNLCWALGFLAEIATWLFGTTATLSRGSVLDACATRYASGDKAKAILGYEPRVGLEEGLKRSCEVSVSTQSSFAHSELAAPQDSSLVHDNLPAS